MASRIVARFTAEDVEALGRARFLKLWALVLPLLNALAGEEVAMSDMGEGSDVLAVASVRQRTVAIEGDPVQLVNSNTAAGPTGVVLAVSEGRAWVKWDLQTPFRRDLISLSQLKVLWV